MFGALTGKKEETAGKSDSAYAESIKPVYQPSVDIYENEAEYVIAADLPGVEQSSLEVILEKNILTLKAKGQDIHTNGYTLVYAEYRPGDYERSFRLHDEVKKSDIQAILKNGVLKLTLPKAKAEVTKIPIKIQ